MNALMMLTLHTLQYTWTSNIHILLTKYKEFVCLIDFQEQKYVTSDCIVKVILYAVQLYPNV